MSEIKLLPCPFCSSSNIVVYYSQVYCKDCGAGTEEGIPTEEAIEKWNTRKPMERIVERLEEVGNIQFSSFTKPLITVEDALNIVRNGGKE